MNKETEINIDEVKKLFAKNKCCVIIPTYNNNKTLSTVIDETLVYTDQIIVVNDGSTDNTLEILKKYKQIIHVISYSKNRGKGYALREAFKKAYQLSFKFAITIDSDGQHDTRDYKKFLENIDPENNVVIIGARNMEQESVPGKSNFGRKFSNFWFNVETGINITDTQSGFRLYPIELLSEMIFFTNRYEFEIEIIVRLAWCNCKILTVPVNVYYAPKEERVSHFRPFTDFFRVSILNTVLVFLALIFFRPLLFFKKLKNQDYKKFVKEYFLNSKESDKKLSLSVALGILCGILPVWGYQMALALILAYLLRLNKIISVTASNISIPPMIPLILYSSYVTGKLLIGNESIKIEQNTQINFDYIKEHLQQYIVGSIVLAVVLSIVLGLATYILLSFFRKEKTFSN